MTLELKLVPETDPILHSPLEDFDFSNPPIDPEELFQSMKEAMIKFKGFGLSANQVGLPYRMFVMGSHDDPGNIFAVFNPKVIDVGDKKSYMDEACLSYPGMIIKVKRPENVRFRFTNEKGITDTIKFTGLSSRIALHETDHLNGLTFMDRANRYHLDMAKRKRFKNKI